MSVDIPRRRALVLAGTQAVFSLRNLFSHELLQRWDTVEADSLAQARFILQHHPCDLLVVHDDIFQRDGREGLTWLGQPREIPTLVLTSDKPQVMTQAYQQGAYICLSREHALVYPQLLAAALERVAYLGEKYRTCQRLQKNLSHCRRHVDRLVHLIWRTTPTDGSTQWCTQRYTMERLEEETSRTQRHGGNLTLVVGELQDEEDDTQKEALAEWAAEVIVKAKRRCDVAGQYGLRGFSLLLVQTPRNGGEICCRRLQQLLQRPPEHVRGPHGRIRASFGLAGSTPERVSPQALLRTADQNLELAKAGQNAGVVAE